MPDVIIFGGYGTFGRHVARELVRAGISTTIAGRDAAKAAAFAAELAQLTPTVREGFPTPVSHPSLTVGVSGASAAVDVRDAEACSRALADHTIAVHCAGPFHEAETTLLDTCLQVGCHYVDIADDRGYVQQVRNRAAAFRGKQRCAVFGASSMPGISEALCQLLHARFGKPQRIRVTLFIGNRNPKGLAAVESCVLGLGRPIATPTGPRFGSRDRVIVPLPEPFGPRAAYNFSTPDFDLLPAEFGVNEVEVKVGFQSRLGSRLLALLARLGSGYGRRTARFLQALAWPMQRFGSSGGAVMAEFFLSDGRTVRASLLARAVGQRMAGLPAALAAQALMLEEPPAVGACTVGALLGHDRFLRQLEKAGFELHADA